MVTGPQFIGLRHNKKEKARFEREGRIWSPGMKNHGQKAVRYNAPLHTAGTPAWVKYVTKTSKQKDPKAIHLMGGALQREAARRLEKGGAPYVGLSGPSQAEKNLARQKNMTPKQANAYIARRARTKGKKKKAGGLSWQDTIKSVRKKNPKMPYKEVLKAASKQYN